MLVIYDLMKNSLIYVNFVYVVEFWVVYFF